MFFEPTLGVVLPGTRHQRQPEEKRPEIFGALLKMIGLCRASGHGESPPD